VTGNSCFLTKKENPIDEFKTKIGKRKDSLTKDDEK